MEIKDGEKLPLAVKDMGSCEVFPHAVVHSPNGRLVVHLTIVCILRFVARYTIYIKYLLFYYIEFCVFHTCKFLVYCWQLWLCVTVGLWLCVVMESTSSILLWL